VAGTAILGRLSWLTATVRDIVPENAVATTLVLQVEDWQGHRPGQHVDVRLTAEDGYQAERSYSIASAPDDPALALTVERIDDGEVSPWMTVEARTGDSFELRGPVGGYFVWDDAETAPVLLVGGGSGVVPLMSMARHRARRGLRTRMRLLYSARSTEDLLYRGELDAMAAAGDGFEVVYTLTRTLPPQWSGFRRRVDAQMLADVSYAERVTSPALVCGPTSFVEAVSKGLVLVGYGAGRVKTERFGPSGGDA
jgi:ferredoxin-NADP reductase